MEDEEIRDLAAKVAGLLLGIWAVDQEWDANGSMIDGPDGMRLHLHQPWSKKGLVTVSGCYPNPNYRYMKPEDHFSINVRADRGAVIVATEINRRLLPEYVKILAEVKEANAKHRAAFAAREEMADAVYEVFGKPRPVHDVSEWQRRQREGETRTEISLYHMPGDLSGSVKIGYDASEMTLELRGIPSGVALAILRMLTSNAG